MMANNKDVDAPILRLAKVVTEGFQQKDEDQIEAAITEMIPLLCTSTAGL